MSTMFTEDSVVEIDGDPEFPLGLYMTSGYHPSREYYLDNHLAEMSEAPVDAIINYWQTAAPMECQVAYFGAQREAGMRYLVTVNNFYPGQYDRTPLQSDLLPEVGEKITKQSDMDTLVRRYADAVSDEPNLLGYYVMDERRLPDVRRHFRQYQCLRGAAKYHPTFGVGPRMTHRYRRLGIGHERPSRRQRGAARSGWSSSTSRCTPTMNGRPQSNSGPCP
jgi:hypothetical protein